MKSARVRACTDSEIITRRVNTKQTNEMRTVRSQLSSCAWAPELKPENVGVQESHNTYESRPPQEEITQAPVSRSLRFGQTGGLPGPYDPLYGFRVGGFGKVGDNHHHNRATGPD